jgi:CHAD domain-containing protein
MPATEVLEIERKYELDEPFEQPPDLPGVTVEGLSQETLDAAYFDTSDLRLLRGGVTLRRRSGGEDEGWHLKLPAGRPGERVELRLPLGDGARVPDEFVDLTLARTRGAPLAQVARLQTERRRWRLMDGDTAVAELVSDAVSAERVGQPADGEPAGGGPAGGEPADGEPAGGPSQWNELEVELVDGQRRLLDELEPRLRELGARPAAAASKVGRALAGVLADTRPASSGPAPDSAGGVVLDYLRRQVEAILANDPKVRRDEPDSVHQMRVATRRARSALQSFRKILDRERTEPVVGELRWLGTVLGSAREAEVQRKRLLGELRALPPELVPGPVVSRVDSHFFASYARAHASALQELRGRRYLDLLDELQRLLDEPPLVERADEPAATVLPRLVGRALRRVRRVLDGDRQGADRDTALHEARKAAKRARYAAAAVAPAVGKPARRSAKRLKAVQQLLGDHQDLVVSRDELRRLAMTAHAEGESGFAYGVMLGKGLAEADRLRAELPRRWRRADRRKIRRWTT